MITASKEKCPSFTFIPLNFKENWTHLAQKNSRPGAQQSHDRYNI